MLNSVHTEADRAKVRAMPWNLAHGALTSVFFLWTFGGSVFVLFLNDLGLPKSQIGILLSFFPFSGLLALIFAPHAARLGRKRVFITAYGSRYFVIINLLFLPALIAEWGRTAGIIFLFVILLIVALLRALGETAYYPWSQEFIPNSIRGMYSAVFTAVSTIAAATALLVAGAVIASGEGISRYLFLIGVGSGVGLVGILVMFGVPGGQPVAQTESIGTHFSGMRSALRDPNYQAYLKGMGAVMLGTVFMTSFLPLYLKEQLVLLPQTVVVMDMVIMVAGALSSIVWGWAADRLGSRPVLMTSLAAGLLVPVGWFILPRQLEAPAIWSGLLYFLYGILSNGAAIGTGRLLFNCVIPPEKSTTYTAIYYAWMGLTGGLAPLLSGWLLTATSSLNIRIAFLTVDGQSVLFVLSFILLSIGWSQYSRVTPDGPFSTRDAWRKLFSIFLAFFREFRLFRG